MRSHGSSAPFGVQDAAAVLVRPYRELPRCMARSTCLFRWGQTASCPSHSDPLTLFQTPN